MFDFFNFLFYLGFAENILNDAIRFSSFAFFVVLNFCMEFKEVVRKQNVGRIQVLEALVQKCKTNAAILHLQMRS